MRTTLFLFLVLLFACSDRNGTTPVDKGAAREKLDVVQVMPAFWQVIDANPEEHAARRATHFRSDVIVTFPALYGPAVSVSADFNAAAKNQLVAGVRDG